MGRQGKGWRDSTLWRGCWNGKARLGWDRFHTLERLLEWEGKARVGQIPEIREVV